MKKYSVLTLLFSAVSFLPVTASAEIILLDDGRAISVNSLNSPYPAPNPQAASLAFAPPQARDTVLSPTGIYFFSGAPTLVGGFAPYIAYPPVIYRSGIHPTANPSNRDNVSYSLTRAHAFSQDLYDKDTDNRAAPRWSGNWPYASGMSYYPYAPVNATGGFNQPMRPSNRDNTTYSLDRAHRFSRDDYKKP